MRILAGLVMGLMLLSGCAGTVDGIEPQYVSALPYRSMSCAEMATEQVRLARDLTALLKRRHLDPQNDALRVIQLGTSPAQAVDDPTRKAARLKGEIEAVQRAARWKRCGLRSVSVPTEVAELPPVR